jgi:hypothetical protein
LRASSLRPRTSRRSPSDEGRVILEAYAEEMRKSGANYQEMFRKVKSELTRKYKAVL